MFDCILLYLIDVDLEENDPVLIVFTDLCVDHIVGRLEVPAVRHARHQQGRIDIHVATPRLVHQLVPGIKWENEFLFQIYLKNVYRGT